MDCSHVTLEEMRSGFIIPLLPSNSTKNILASHMLILLNKLAPEFCDILA